MLARSPTPQEQRYTAYLAEKAFLEAQQRAALADYDRRLWDWLGDRPAAVASVENSRASLFELTVTIIGKTEDAVREAVIAYQAKYEPHIYLTRFFPVEPWHKGFRAVGTRREGI